MSAEQIKVGIAELKTCPPNRSIITNGLGSCVGVCLWDSRTKIGGLVHVMLPDSTQSRDSVNKAKFADTGIPALIDEMTKLGASPSRLVAKIAGGAQMFNFPDSANKIKIGERNAEAVKAALAQKHIRVAAQDCGGTIGRTIEFFTEDGRLSVRTINQGEKFI
ncbi:MAG: chemotaxis protein CheD [Peptococcaceae bacterium]|nr:chemotaxis protein CheD [Peptococcaceae bacterium]